MKIKIAELAGKHGLMTAYALQKALNISPTMASRLWKGGFDKIGINTMEKLCDYFYCQPNDFLEYPLTRISNTELSNDVTQLSNTELSKPQSASDNEIIGSIEAGRIIGINNSLVTRYAKEGRLKGQQGRKGTKRNQWTFRRSDVLEFMPK
jgi:DNA-binding Xre family transcriptional regulator